MKIKEILILLSVLIFVLTACEDTKRKEQQETLKEEQREAEREAKLLEEEERKKMEANSIAARAMEEQSLDTFITAMQNTDLADFFTEEQGPFTIFAPTNEAFDKINEESRNQLFENEKEDELVSLLEYHVIQDEITYEDLLERIKNGEGEYSISTMNGAELTALMSGENVVLKDQKGNTASIENKGIPASNGVLYFIDAVLTGEDD